MKKNKKQLKIEDAFVPVEEQPYEVPENWCWVKLESICTGFQYGYTEKTSYEKIGPKYIRITDIGDGVIDDEKAPYCKIEDEQFVKYKIKKNDIFIARMGSVGENGLAMDDMDAVFASYVIRIIPKYNAKYIRCFLQSGLYWRQISDKSQGTTRLNVNANVLKSLLCPLPPLPEQQRIVERIESLFSKLDEAKEKAKEALESFEERQVAILHKAFKGELTLQWRTEHGLDMSSWRDVPLKDCGRWFGGGTPTTSKKEYWEGGDILWITSKDMKEKIIKDSLMHVTMVGVENSSANYCEEPAVLFVMRSGILRRVFPVSMVRRPFTVNQDLKACVPEGILQEYLYWHCTGFEKDIRDNCMKSGTTVESVEAKKLYEYEISVAGIDEQKEIVNRIEELLNKEVAAYEVAENVIESIELVKKSILAKAFRGELGTNNPSDESSIELLKQVIKE